MGITERKSRHAEEQKPARLRELARKTNNGVLGPDMSTPLGTDSSILETAPLKVGQEKLGDLFNKHMKNTNNTKLYDMYKRMAARG
jgi:hypothetical protein